MSGISAETDPARPDPARPTDEAIEAAILGRLARVRPGGSICPSEAARALDADWRPLMGAVRAAAARLAARGRLRVTQKGRAVDAETARGPIRLAPPAEAPEREE